MKKYRLILDQNTFLWVKKKEGLVYQSNKHRALIFSLTEKINEICRHLLVLEHLYKIDFTDEDLNNLEVRRFVNQLLEIDAGKLIPLTGMEKGAVSLMPVLKIHEKIEDFVIKHERGIGGNIIKHIHELTFYVNGSKYGSDYYYRQTIFPTKHESMLEVEKIIRFTRNSKNLFLSNINLVGNIFSLPGINELLHQIETFEVKVTICMIASDVLENLDKLRRINWNEKTSFRILMDHNDIIETVVSFFEKIGISFSVDFFIFSEQDFLKIEKKSMTTHGNFIPMYNGENIDFFETNVFILKEEILASALSKRQIFMRQATNLNHYGKLTVLPKGDVYADVNETSLGTIEDNVYSIIYKEFTEGKSWFKVRDFSPCNDCIFQWLCPSPSNYEMVIGRPNLCHMKQNT